MWSNKNISKVNERSSCGNRSGTRTCSREGLAIADNNMTRNRKSSAGGENTRGGGHVRCGSRVQEPFAAMGLVRRHTMERREQSRWDLWRGGVRWCMCCTKCRQGLRRGSARTHAENVRNAGAPRVERPGLDNSGPWIVGGRSLRCSRHCQSRRARCWLRARTGGTRLVVGLALLAALASTVGRRRERRVRGWRGRGRSRASRKEGGLRLHLQ